MFSQRTQYFIIAGIPTFFAAITAFLAGTSNQLVFFVSIFSGVLTAAMGLLFAFRFGTTNAIERAGEMYAVQEAVDVIRNSKGARQTVATSTTQFAESVHSSMQQVQTLAEMVRLNADHAKNAAALSHTTDSIAQKGAQEMQTLNSTMTDVSDSAKQIEAIITVIDDIAFQTNLLALNAAVEAARAGEQGKGFAVVAEAVRALAQRSAAAAKDINSLIKTSVENAEKGKKAADSSSAILKEIVLSVKKVSDLNTEISAANHEQATGIAEISRIMNDIERLGSSVQSKSQELINALNLSEEQLSQMHLPRVTPPAKAAVKFEAAKKATQNEAPKKSNLVFFKPKEASPAPAAHAPAKLNKPAAPRYMTPKNPPPSKHSAPAKSAKPQETQLKMVVPKSKAADLIPFDDDDRKIGTTDGF
jgi:methyl-accepting chemotaxis protein